MCIASCFFKRHRHFISNSTTTTTATPATATLPHTARKSGTLHTKATGRKTKRRQPAHRTMRGQRQIRKKVKYLKKINKKQQYNNRIFIQTSKARKENADQRCSAQHIYIYICIYPLSILYCYQLVSLNFHECTLKKGPVLIRLRRENTRITITRRVVRIAFKKTLKNKLTLFTFFFTITDATRFATASCQRSLLSGRKRTAPSLLGA